MDEKENVAHTYKQTNRNVSDIKKRDREVGREKEMPTYSHLDRYRYT